MDNFKGTILMLGVGADQIIAIEKAKRMDLRVIGFDGNDKAKGMSACDVFEHVNIKDCDATEKMALKYNKKYNIDAAIAPAVEGTAIGRVVDVLGLRGINEKTCKIMTDKVMRCEKFPKIPVPTPRWGIDNTFDIFPCVIKPRDQAGAKGVKYIENRKQLKSELNVIHELGLEQSYFSFDVVQEYIEGWELSVEVLVFDDQSCLAITADRNYDKKFKWSPHLIEDGCQLPSKIPQHIKNKVGIIVQKIIDHFTLRSCTIKLDLVVKDNVVYVLECAARMGGGKLSSVMIPLSYNYDYWYYAISIAMGYDCPKMPDTFERGGAQFVAQRYVFPDKVESHYDRITDYIAIGDTYDEAISNAELMVREHK